MPATSNASQRPAGPGDHTDSVIRMNSVDAHHGQTLALRSIDLSIHSGTVTAVIGPNGAGKSTLFALISGRDRPSAGTITVKGEVAEVLQATDIDDRLSLTVDDVVRIGRYSVRGLLGRIRRSDREVMDDALERVGLAAHRRRPMRELSGGERQRALIAQGLVQGAPVLVLDEPTAALDVPSHQLTLDIMRAEATDGRTVLFSTHDLSSAAHADTVIALACSCVCCAPPMAAFGDPAVTALFEKPLRRDAGLAGAR